MSYLDLFKQAAPSTPGADYNRLWPDNTTEKLVYVDDAGARHGSPISKNFSTASQSPATSTDVYITNSGILVPAYGMEAGQMYRWTIMATKTATGTTADVWNIRLGTNQSTADTSRLAITASQVQTAAVDDAIIEVRCLVRSVGASGVLVGAVEKNHSVSTTATGFGGGGAAVSSSFDNSAVAGNYLGLSVNSQAGVWTILGVVGWLES